MSNREQKVREATEKTFQEKLWKKKKCLKIRVMTMNQKKRDQHVLCWSQSGFSQNWSKAQQFFSGNNEKERSIHNGKIIDIKAVSIACVSLLKPLIKNGCSFQSINFISYLLTCYNVIYVCNKSCLYMSSWNRSINRKPSPPGATGNE